MSLLPGLTQSAPGVPIFAPASGGGGGGGGTDLVVSSIVVNTKNSSPGGGIAFSYDFPNNSSVIPAGMVGLQEGVITGVGIGNTNAVLVGQDNGGLAQTGDFGAARIILGTQGTGASAVAKPILVESNGLVSIIPGISTLALNVSSINGSAPGGGGSVGPNPSFSTITLNGTSGVGIPNVNFAGDNAVVACINGVQFTDSPYTNSQIILTPQNPPTIQLNNNSNQYGIQIGVTTDGYGYIQSGTAGSGIALSNISSINGAAPGGGGSAVSTFNSLTISSGSVALNGTLQITGTDTNLYQFFVNNSNASSIATMSLGTIGGRNQFNAYVGEIDNFFCSSINGAAPGGGGLTNFTIPFITGSGDGTTWTINVDSNTGGIPVALTSTLVTSPANSYLVSYSLFGGSNSDTAQFTKLSVYTASGGGNPIIQTCPGLVSNNWLSNGFMGARSLIVSGASAIRLQAEDYSPTVSTLLYFDQSTAFKVTNLGASS